MKEKQQNNSRWLNPLSDTRNLFEKYVILYESKI